MKETRLLHLLKQLRSVPPREAGAAQKGRAQFIAQFEALPTSNLGQVAKAGRGARGWGWLRLAGLRSAALVMLAALLLSGTGVAYASQGALPNDTLFPIKRFIEDLRLSVSSDDGEDARLLLRFTQQRVVEMEGLVAEQRFDDLSIPAGIYSDQLLQLLSIIVEFQQAGDPRAEHLLLALIEALQLNEQSLTSLLEDSPDELEGSEVESAVSITQSIATQQALAGPPAVAEFRGRLNSLSDTEAVVCGISFSLSAGTEFDDGIIPQPGDPVKVDFAVGASGFIASKVDPEDEPEDCELRVEGPLAARGDLGGASPWQVSGIEFLVDGSTDLRDNPLLGEFVQVRAIPITGGFLATRIESDEAEERIEAQGDQSSEDDEDDDDDNEARLKDIEPDKARQGQTLSITIEAENSHFAAGSQLGFQPSGGITINSISVQSATRLTANISIASGAALGDRQVSVSTAGEVVSGEELRIEAAVSSSGSSSGSEEDDEGGQAELKDLEPDRGNRGQTLNVVVIGENTHFSSGSVVSFGSGITVNSVSVQSTTRLTANITISSGAAFGKRTVRVTTGSEVATGEEFEVRSGSSGGSSSPTATPNSSNVPVEVRFTGTVQSISSSSWTVGGKIVQITSFTEIKDNPQVGDVVEVRALQQSNGSLVAERIELDD